MSVQRSGTRVMDTDLIWDRGGRLLQGDEPWRPETPAPKDKTIHVYKLHGSLHFQITERVVKDKVEARVLLKERPYTRQHGTLKFTIIPPEWNKQYDRGAFARLWRSASAAIHNAKNLVFVGYSLPSTDMHATVLFRTSVKKQGLRSLVVVNPDPEARRRTRDVVQRGISKSTRVLSFDSLKEFAAADRGLWGDG
ncbi:MAG: SIR2 family protein [Bryobacteraceae bacterium]